MKTIDNVNRSSTLNAVQQLFGHSILNVSYAAIESLPNNPRSYGIKERTSKYRTEDKKTDAIVHIDRMDHNGVLGNTQSILGPLPARHLYNI